MKPIPEGKSEKKVIDEVAATIILENYLAYRRNQKGENSNGNEGLL